MVAGRPFRRMNEARYRAAERQLWKSLGATPTERRLHLASNHVTVRVQELGEGPALLFLHGGNTSGSSWATMAARLGGPSHHPGPTRHRVESTSCPSLRCREPEPVRRAGHKWEPCLRNKQTFRASSLLAPCSDIYYHHRESGMKPVATRPIPYALIVGLRAPRVSDLYDRVVRSYASVLVPLQPQVRIQLRT